MGGSIGVTIRKANGEEFRRCRWTNALPGLFNNIDFFTKDDSYLNDYIERGESMRRDWLKNKETEEFEFNMSPVYGPYDTLAPTEYGLVVIDYKTKTVLSCQGYCSSPDVIPGYAFFQGIKIEKRKAVLSGRHSFDEGFDPLLNAKKIYEGKYISSYEFWSGEKFEKVEVDYSTFKDFDDFVIKLEKISGERLSGLYLNLDTKDWTVNSFEESPEGFMEMKERIKELGFVLSEEEENEWKEFIEYKYE